MSDQPHHPAKFTDVVSVRLHELVAEAMMLDPAVAMGARPLLLDPYAGVGGTHALADRLGFDSIGVEIEPPWADTSPRTVCGDSRQMVTLLPDYVGKVAAAVFSADYGNRMADQYVGPEDRRSTSYARSLRRRVTDGSGAGHQWGPAYREIHTGVMDAIVAMLAPEGWWFCNMSSHIRQGKYAPVMEWWLDRIAERARIVKLVPVVTSRMRHGQNHEARVPAEHIIVARALP